MRRTNLRRTVNPWAVVTLVLALATLEGPGISAARGATLRWKFKPGETLRYTMDQKSVATGKIPGGQEFKSTMSQTIDMTWTVKSVDANGLAELTQTITRIRDQIEAPVGSYTYDSKDPKEPEGLIAATKLPVFKALLGTAVPFKMSPLGEAADVRVPDSLVKMLAELGPAAAGAGGLFSEEGLKEMISRAGLILPEQDLSEGKTWTRQARSASPVGTFVLDTTYRYDGPAPGAGPDAARISVAIKADLQKPAADPNANANPSPGGLKIHNQKSQGTFVFDASAGHILESSLTEFIEIGASVKVGLGATAKEMEVIQSNETTTIRKLAR